MGELNKQNKLRFYAHTCAVLLYL